MKRVLVYTGILLLFGCKGEPVFQTEQLVGRWEVYDAERNGKKTALLNKAVFLFEADGSLMTNFTGQDDRGTFSLEDNVILFQNGDGIQFRIQSLRDDTLSMSTELQRMQFNLLLHRSSDEAH